MANLAERQNVMLNPFDVIIERLDAIQAEITALKKIQAEPKVEKFLNSKEVCALLQISAPTRLQLAKTGRLIPLRVGRKLLYSQKSVDEALKHYSRWDRF